MSTGNKLSVGVMNQINDALGEDINELVKKNKGRISYDRNTLKQQQKV